MAKNDRYQGEYLPGFLEQYEDGRDELNLAEFPMSVPGRKHTGHTAQYSDVITDKGTGRAVKRTVEIRGGGSYGLPTYYDEDVLFGVLQLTNIQRRGEQWPSEVRFSRYSLAKILGLKTDGRTYKRLWDSLQRLASTTYHFQFSFFDNEEKEWKPSVTMNFIQTLEVHGGALPGKFGDVTIKWHDDIHGSFESGYLRNINVIEYRSLGLPLAKALYRFLGKHFHRAGELNYPVDVLAYEKLGLSRNYKIGKIKEKLQPAIERLENCGFIQAASDNERYRKLKPGAWEICFRKGKEKEQTVQPVPAIVSNEQSMLIDRGVNQSSATELINKFPPEFILQKIEEFDFLESQENPPKNPGGWIVQSLTQNWNPPRGFKTAEQREEESRKQKERRDRNAKKKAREKSEQLAQAKAEARNSKLATAYLESLTPEQMKEFEEGIKRKNSMARQISQELFEALKLQTAIEHIQNDNQN